MSGSEIATFFKYFPIFIGEFIPSGDKVWKLILSLHNLMNMVYKDSFTGSDIVDLTNEIEKHHKLFMELLSKELTYKHHIITHYPTVIDQLGPPKQMGTIRAEGFHKISKSYADATSSRKNFLKSLAEKHQYYHIFNSIKSERLLSPPILRRLGEKACSFLCL
uniref:Uncharacterized protein n=1 Tax=Megaselia scalaris TaxID=36166 RepID=T1GZ92_MEGSC